MKHLKYHTRNKHHMQLLPHTTKEGTNKYDYYWLLTSLNYVHTIWETHLEIQYSWILQDFLGSCKITPDPKWQLHGWGSRDGAVVRALASHQCGPGFVSWTQRQKWVEFVVGSLPCSERFFFRYSGFPLSSKTNISKFQFDLDTVDKEPPCGCATAYSHLFIYLFVCLFIYIYLFILVMYPNRVL